MVIAEIVKLTIFLFTINDLKRSNCLKIRQLRQNKKNTIFLW